MFEKLYVIKTHYCSLYRTVAELQNEKGNYS